jgi:hypothetical protein
VYIVVNTITELKTPQSHHGKKMARLVRECLANYLELTIDFEGIKTVSDDFFHEFLLPLTVEYGVDYLNDKLQMINLVPEINNRIQKAFSDFESYFNKRPTNPAKNYDQEIYAINLAWLIKAREVSKASPVLAELVLGVSDPTMLNVLSGMTFGDIQYLARTNWLCFAPRFSTHFLQNNGTQQRQLTEVMIGFSEF